jgi:hypothetical protein
MPDQDIPLQAHHRDDALYVVGPGGKVVPPVGRDRFTPSALVNGDATSTAAHLIDHFIPSPTRTASVVQENTGWLT